MEQEEPRVWRIGSNHLNKSPERIELHRKKAVEYGTLLGLQESTATKKSLGVRGRILSLQGICEQKPAQRKEKCILL